MDMIPLDSQVREGDLVITSGLGGNFPPDLVIGQVTSVSLSPDALNRVAQVHSLVDFDTLEFVLVVTNFQPIDLSVFDQRHPVAITHGQLLEPPADRAGGRLAVVRHPADSHLRRRTRPRASAGALVVDQRALGAERHVGIRRRHQRKI